MREAEAMVCQNLGFPMPDNDANDDGSNDGDDENRKTTQEAKRKKLGTLKVPLLAIDDAIYQVGNREFV